MRIGEDGAPGGEATAARMPEDALVANAVAARTVNAAIFAGRRDDAARANLVCECGVLGCHAVLPLSPAEYELARADAQRFVIAPGHEAARDEIVTSTERYTIVTKRGAAAALAPSGGPGAGAHASAAYRVPTVSFAFPATAEAVPAARHWIAEFVDAHSDDAELRGRILLAFSEAFTNAVLHTRDPGRPRHVHVAADVEHGSLEIVVSDEGPGLSPSEADGLGVGLSIVARSTDAFAIRERTPAGTEVWLSFTLDSPA